MMHSRSRRQLLIDAVAERQALIARRECRERRRHRGNDARCTARSPKIESSQIRSPQIRSSGQIKASGRFSLIKCSGSQRTTNGLHGVENKHSRRQFQNRALERCSALPAAQSIFRSTSRPNFGRSVLATLRSFLFLGMTAAKDSAPMYTEWQSNKSRI